MKSTVNQSDGLLRDTRMKIVVLWISLLLLYIYADIFSFYRPGYIREVAAGFMGPLAVNQTTLAASGTLMAIPVLIMVSCLFVATKTARWINIVAGGLYTIVGIGNLVGETWVYYWIYGVIEVLIAAGITGIAFKWPIGQPTLTAPSPTPEGSPAQP